MKNEKLYSESPTQCLKKLKRKKESLTVTNYKGNNKKLQFESLTQPCWLLESEINSGPTPLETPQEKTSQLFWSPTKSIIHTL